MANQCDLSMRLGQDKPGYQIQPDHWIASGLTRRHHWKLLVEKTQSRTERLHSSNCEAQSAPLKSTVEKWTGLNGFGFGRTTGLAEVEDPDELPIRVDNVRWLRLAACEHRNAWLTMI